MARPSVTLLSAIAPIISGRQVHDLQCPEGDVEADAFGERAAAEAETSIEAQPVFRRRNLHIVEADVLIRRQVKQEITCLTEDQSARAGRLRPAAMSVVDVDEKSFVLVVTAEAQNRGVAEAAKLCEERLGVIDLHCCPPQCPGPRPPES